MYEKRRILVFSDIHGEYQKLLKLMENVEPEFDKDLLIFLGDYIDRGEQSYEVVDYLSLLQITFPKNMVFLKGNHEDMLMQILSDVPFTTPLWIQNGGSATQKSYERYHMHIPNNIPFKHLQLLYNLKLFYETEHFIFVHAAIRPGISLEDTSDDILLWDRRDTLPKTYPKHVIVGHTIVSKPVIKDKLVMIDTGSFLSMEKYGEDGYITCLELPYGDDSLIEDFIFHNSK